MRYKDLNRDSGVQAYDIGTDSISVQFKDRHTYLYTYRSAGKYHIERMKVLAIGGSIT